MVLLPGLSALSLQPQAPVVPTQCHHVCSPKWPLIKTAQKSQEPGVKWRTLPRTCAHTHLQNELFKCEMGRDVNHHPCIMWRLTVFQSVVGACFILFDQSSAASANRSLRGHSNASANNSACALLTHRRDQIDFNSKAHVICLYYFTQVLLWVWMGV